jgi:alpha-glucuronidase
VVVVVVEEEKEEVVTKWRRTLAGRKERVVRQVVCLLLHNLSKGTQCMITRILFAGCTSIS